MTVTRKEVDLLGERDVPAEHTGDSYIKSGRKFQIFLT
ncbi:Uncharacterised protein [Haemophilus influenzae]|uniref:Uncharacterized protein n=1 Tax=Haemophilus influenzae TaxID=727 RepID=A0A2X1PIT0_HAEIF|nr:Uncharacterised protein [Haemophilus influenzae]